MALSGSTISWAESAPAGAESIGLGDNRIRSMKTDLRTALDSEHVWPSAGGVAGQHRAGSARAFYGAQSAVSASDTSNVADGRLMVASDTSRLFGVNSLGTVLLGGGPFTPSFGSHLGVTFPQRSYLAIEAGEGIVVTGDHCSVTFPNSGFSNVPFVFLQQSRSTAGANTVNPAAFFALPSDSSVRKDGFVAVVQTGAVGGSTCSGNSIYWLAVGTRTL